MSMSMKFLTVEYTLIEVLCSLFVCTHDVDILHANKRFTLCMTFSYSFILVLIHMYLKYKYI